MALPKALFTYYCVTTTYEPTGKTVRVTAIKTETKPHSSYSVDGKKNVYRDYFCKKEQAERFAAEIGGDMPWE